MNRLPIVLVAGLALTLVACERPFVDLRVPEVEVVEPSPDVILVESEHVLRIRATSFRDVASVLLNGTPMTLRQDGLWEAPIQLGVGVNAFEITALDVDELPGIDTLRFVHLPYRFDPGPLGWPTAVGGHAAIALQDGSILISGGAQRVDAPASATLQRFSPASNRFDSEEFQMLQGRVGHALTPLAEGEFIVTGGARRAFPGAVSDLVEMPERVSLGQGRARPMVVEGPPIRRAYHTASIRRTPEGLVLDLLGGLGDVQYSPQPLFGVRNDLRRFLIRGDTLVALNTAPGFYIERLAGHIQIDLDRSPPAQPTIFLVAGTVFDGTFIDQYAFRFNTGAPSGIELRSVSEPGARRFGAAGELIAPGMVLRVGGQTFPGLPPEPTGDVFAGDLDRFFPLAPELVTGAPPVLHGTATFFSEGRILLLGGFTSSGSAYTPVTYFVVDN